MEGVATSQPPPSIAPLRYGAPAWQIHLPLWNTAFGSRFFLLLSSTFFLLNLLDIQGHVFLLVQQVPRMWQVRTLDLAAHFHIVLFHIQIAIDNSSLPTADECSTVSRISPSDNLDRPLERSYRCTEVAVID